MWNSKKISLVLDDSLFYEQMEFVKISWKNFHRHVRSCYTPFPIHSFNLMNIEEQRKQIKISH